MPVNTSKTELRSYFDIDNNVEYINLKPYLEHSHQKYNYFLVENNLTKLKQREKQKLGIHFILNEILSAIIVPLISLILTLLEIVKKLFELEYIAFSAKSSLFK